MPIGAIVASPPYVDSGNADHRRSFDKLAAGIGRNDKRARGPINRKDYGTTPGQLAALREGAPIITGTKRMKRIKQLEWHGLYDQSWKGAIVPGAFVHPAKFSRALIRKIYEYMIERKWIKEGDTVLDPFAGVALGALDAMTFGLNWEGCELESKFVALANENIALWNSRYAGKLPRWGTARVVQGDSRRLRDALCIAAADVAVSSPPYASQAIEKNSKSIDRRKQYETYRAQGGGASFGAFCATQDLHSQGYGTTSGQLAALREGDVESVISSPPYAGARVGDECGAEHVGHNGNYGSEPGQLGAMPEGVISSPPFQGAHDGLGLKDAEGILAKVAQKYGNNRNRLDEAKQEGYGSSPAQLGSMKEGVFDSAVSSPPFQKSDNRKGGSNLAVDKAIRTGRNPNAPSVQGVAVQNIYGKSDGQLGETQGETFWSAARTIVSECYAALAPGGHAAWVCKDFVRNKQIVPFCDQWRQLCESVGFETVAIARAWQTKDDGTQLATDGNHKRLFKRKAGFFRRLHIAKYPHLAIDYEIVLFQVKK